MHTHTHNTHIGLAPIKRRHQPRRRGCYCELGCELGCEFLRGARQAAWNGFPFLSLVPLSSLQHHSAATPAPPLSLCPATSTAAAVTYAQLWLAAGFRPANPSAAAAAAATPTRLWSAARAGQATGS